MSTIHNKPPVSGARVLGLAAFMLVIFAIYAAHLFRMQVLEGYVYLNRAQQTTRRSEPIFAQRGRIYAADGETVLAANRSSFALTLVPAEISRWQTDRMAELAALLRVSEATLREPMEEARAGSFQAVEVLAGLTLGDVTRVAERIERFPGVSWYSKPERVYPRADLTAHVVGYVGGITPQELQVLYNEGYGPTSVLGKSGIEQQYDQVLRGNDGQRFRTVDARGRRVGESEDEIPPEPGQSLVLTIDPDLQQLAQDALGPRIGSVTALRPATGEILAMVSYPRFNPNQFGAREGREAFNRLALDERSPFINRPIQSVAAPASTFKIVMTTAILQENAFDPLETINCRGTFEYGNRTFNDWLEVGHGRMDLAAALAQSCNVYFWTMGASHLDVDQIIDYSGRLGLGRPTGIDLPGERIGIVPSPAWKEQNLNARWVGGDTVNMSIGEGYLQVTPLQLATMVATIANDGRTYRPHLLKEVRDPVTGATIRRTEPELIREAELSLETLQAVQESMRGVITDGTARVVITTEAVEAAGKTGTGQVGSQTNWTSWFVAYAPYGRDVAPDERIVLVVMVDAANEWEWWAPKAANIILHGYFTDQNFDETVADLRASRRGLWYM